MGSITFQVIGDASVGTKTKTYSVPDAHINRLVAWASIAFVGPGDPPLATAPALLAWANNMMETTKASVISSEQNSAAVAATQAFTAT